MSLDVARRGTPVHAGSFPRERRIVLDAGLSQPERQRILLHELFHFAWVRLSNARRESYAALIGGELSRRARGEMGWSAEWRKAELPRRSARFFREYLSESFCDTAAWRYGSLRIHDEFTLTLRWRTARREWLDEAFPGRVVKL